MHHHSLISDMTAVQSLRHSKRLKVFFIGRQHDHLHCFSIQHEPNETWLSDAANSSIKNPDCAAAKIEGQEGLTTFTERGMTVSKMRILVPSRRDCMISLAFLV